ncbi:Receptor-like protein kinase [Thalictrum thalictroides]|uniref:non-specific serine/threonine protein kinase n=1 Tax=Thalictrum thalictroides TaxID=46969 RepID=A0A7J6VI95_THATH|nr:Receptor-like protein kinase [Thalictrum thalictroides]
MTSISKDAMSLLSIKKALTFNSSSELLSNWNLTVNHCDWYGVTCDKVSGRVISLNITGSMTSLLSGTLASDIGNLTHLKIICLAYNAFNGEIPMEITKLKSLEVLQLQGNRFSGSIPEKLIGFGELRVLDLSFNQLNGIIKIDSSSRCDSLVHLKLSGNFLIDRIPPEIGNCSNLKSLLLDQNILEYKIPVEIGLISELEVLDVSRNSLTDKIPKELAKCRKLSALVLTNLVDSGEGSRREFNAFDGGIPFEVFLLPELEIIWAPRANLGGRIPLNLNHFCKLRILNLGQNYVTGFIPERIGFCKNLTFLDLSSNALVGSIPSQLQVSCMVYFNVTRNSLSGNLTGFAKASCSNSSQDINFFEEEIVGKEYFFVPLQGSRVSKTFKPLFDGDFVVAHDFSWNKFIGELPLFSFGDGFVPIDHKPSYKLLLNNNQFNGSIPGTLFPHCENLHSFLVNVSMNQISGGIPQGFFNCLQLTRFEAAYNQLRGLIPQSIGNLQMLQYLDVRGNRLTGSIPKQVGKIKDLKWFLLGGNNFTGQFPTQLGQLASLTVLDLSRNALSGAIPSSLANARNLQILLLDHNILSGVIPSSFSTLANLTRLNVSYNNLSGDIPFLQHWVDCSGFKGNLYLARCHDLHSGVPSGLPVPFEVHKLHTRNKAKLVIIVLVASVVVLLFILVTVIVLVSGRRKLGRFARLKRKQVVTFVEVPTELNYDSVVRATGNFSVQYLIGTGGFGATYKAELVPGFLVAVKRLYIGRFQGVQQFDAEIRTLGRIRHQNLVTLIGYHMGEAEMFLIYNYLSGGNLETFIHENSGNNVQWSVIHKIALDIAQALAYLHYSCDPRIVHRDIKPSNILLDEDLNAYLSDFGLARLLEVTETHATTDVAGTFGYVAPEYAMTCRVSDKADVYSFGVVLLELMSGKRSLDPSFSNYGNGFNIVTWAKMLIKEGRSSEFFSPELWRTGPQENLLGMLRLASACTVESLAIRLSMIQVAEKLKQLNIPES